MMPYGRAALRRSRSQAGVIRRESPPPDKISCDVTSITHVKGALMKKGRHRRFEEARKLKQSGPGAFDLGLGGTGGRSDHSSDDEYAALAEKYGVTFDDDEDDDDR
jgi:hypothetical protein